MTGDGGLNILLLITTGRLIIKSDVPIATLVQAKKPVSSWRQYRDSYSYVGCNKHFLLSTARVP